MIIKNLFDAESYLEIKNRIDVLTKDTPRSWGKMNVSQMLKHLQVGFILLLQKKPVSRIFFGRLIGWMFKKIMYDDSIWKKNLPTSPLFKVITPCTFEEEKSKLLDLISQFHQTGRTGIGDKVHPFFGKFTADQWGITMWKHIDHHLRQFGV